MDNQLKPQKLTRKIFILDTGVLLVSLMFGFAAAYFIPVSPKAYLACSFILALIFMLLVFSVVFADTSRNSGARRRTSDGASGGWFGGESCGGDGCGGDGGGADGGGGI
ncbi:hypothetical protein [Pseudomonas serbica]|uniref:hypothetical protein n=1 Tax=Pseudomonas serbica TaxID=2965074 RepID=UPI00237B771A|nr:hypothetical protein [Pseudomonas serbica]